MKNALTIAPLRSNPQAIETIAAWIDKEWGAFSGRSRQETDQRFRAELNLGDSALPLSLVAHIGDKAAGLVSLRERDSADWDPATRPWVCNVYVPHFARGRGLAKALCLAIEPYARALDFSEIYLASEKGEASLYAKLGYRVYDSRASNIGRQFLMRKRLAT